MCNYSAYILDKGIQQGKDQKELIDIKNLMKSMNWSLQQAMDALIVPAENRQKYTELLKQESPCPVS